MEIHAGTYVINSRKYRLSDILNAIPENHQGQSMDIVKYLPGDY